ncbi:MAG TPA: hypothetical protein PLZ53_10685 [Candidatus Hydrogenedentes bacterium]|mgnify:CR=1 FL=1|jgi:hypothetical protein|nr:MAG: hypothetical protein BWY07_00522 [Candidatus Hydrogenedentes bacterium ADurb.Bin170]HNZ48697.1 hypothetical protein [Candidatus Hydrogenedentota bacterium]HOD94938.1 hypothetical protein [Candidatus Hydrogenedentota bacterium]HOH43574.1 hypothetical protein [Candidatus Hydrogenedentota bacterium]HOM49359.1 hypothetical protein [Candidatus Hydrogenedentota bacterium]
MPVHPVDPEDERCYGSCFACIPTCPRHPENQELSREQEAENLRSASSTEAPASREETGQEDA